MTVPLIVKILNRHNVKAIFMVILLTERSVDQRNRRIMSKLIENMCITSIRFRINKTFFMMYVSRNYKLINYAKIILYYKLSTFQTKCSFLKTVIKKNTGDFSKYKFSYRSYLVIPYYDDDFFVSSDQYVFFFHTLPLSFWENKIYYNIIVEFLAKKITYAIFNQSRH